LLQNARGINYIGFVEGDGLYRGEADVVVCDGFVGNILLKSSEGLATMIAARIEALFKKSLLSRLVGALALPLMKRLQADLRRRGITAQAFGVAGHRGEKSRFRGVQGFQSAIQRALIEIQENLPSASTVVLRICCLGVFVGQCLNVTARFNWPSNCQFLRPQGTSLSDDKIIRGLLHVCFLAFVFPGQGSQSLGMLAELGAQHPADPRNLQRSFRGSGLRPVGTDPAGPEEQLNQTDKTQPAILTASIALWRLWLAEGGARPAFVAGHSLGEYSALVAAGSLSLAMR
jgi:hypothetical protein